MYYFTIIISLWMFFSFNEKVESAALQVDTKDLISQAVAAVSTNNTNPNITVSIHSPIVVSAMSFPEINITSPPDLTTTQEPPRHPLAPEVFNSGFALINGTPVFIHPSPTGDQQLIERLPTTTPPTPANATTTQTSVLTQVLQHLGNISQHLFTTVVNMNNSSAISGTENNATSVKINLAQGETNPGNLSTVGTSSSVSVVVVPIIQNAYDMVDKKNPSLAQLASENPIVLSQKNGSNTILQVLVGVEGGRSRSNSFTSSQENNISLPITTSESTTTTHAPLIEDVLANSTTSTPLQHLSTSKILIAQPLATGDATLHNYPEAVLVTTGDMISMMVENASSAMVNSTPFLQAEPSLSQGSVLTPSVVVPEKEPILKMVAKNSEDQTTHPSVMSERLATTTMDSSILSVDVSTLPSAPRVPLDISEPIQLAKPLTPGTFAFLPVQEKDKGSVLNPFKMDLLVF